MVGAQRPKVPQNSAATSATAVSSGASASNLSQLSDYSTVLIASRPMFEDFLAKQISGAVFCL